jgi:O-antigen/teichoic acid export membrane protein
MNVIKERKLGIMLGYLAITLRNILNLLLIPFIIHYVGVSHYGVYSLVAALAGYLVILEFGLSNTVIRFLSLYQANFETEKSSQFIGVMFSIYSFISLTAIVAGAILYLQLDSIFSTSLTVEEVELLKVSFLVLLVNVVITLLGNTYTGIISAYEKFTFQKIVEIFAFLFRCTLIFYGLTNGFGIIAITVIDTFINLIQTLIRMYFVHRKLLIRMSFNYPDTSTIKEIFTYTFFIALNVIVNQINWRVDNFIIGTLTDSRSLGIFNIGSQFILSFIAFASAISNVFTPKIIKMVSLNSTPLQLTEELVKIGRLQLIVLGFIFISFFSYGELFIQLFVGDEFYLAYWVALISMLPFTFVLVQTSTNAVLQAMNKHKVRSILLVVTALLNIIISIALVKQIGMIGASIGTGLTLFLGELVLVNIYLVKYIKLDMAYFYIQLIKGCFPAILLCGICSYLFSFNLSRSWLDLIIGCLFTFVVYSVLSYVLTLTPQEKKFLVKQVKR